MIELYMDKSVFSVYEEFYVRDRTGKKRYRVTGMPLSLNKKIIICDEKSHLVSWVEKPPISLSKDTYDIYVHGKKQAVIYARMFHILPWQRHRVAKVNWEVNGSVFEHNFTLTKGFSEIASVHKKLMSFGDCYELRIRNPENELLVLAVTVALNAIEADHRIAKDLESRKSR